MNYSKAIEIAPDIYWIGYVIPNDPFQCHVYLIKNGEESILIDPGSMITFPVVLEKITSLIPLRDIKYIIMHHQDPDIVGCYTTLEKLFPKGERYIVTHWRTEMLLKHYQWETPFYLINENEWKLKAGNRKLEFVFTPYAHFPGAFCTYDKKSKILFSSDLFGGLTPKFELFAKSVDEYFEYAKIFHEHYIPSKEVLNYAINKIEKKSPVIIAPQHGSIIKKDLIKPFFNKLKKLNCGFYLMDDYISDIKFLDKIEEIFKIFLNKILSLSLFEDILKELFVSIKHIIPSFENLDIYINIPYIKKYHYKYSDISYKNSFSAKLYDKGNNQIGKITLFFSKEITEREKHFLQLLIKKIEPLFPLTFVLQELESQNKKLYYKATTDNLTKVYNREFMKEFLPKTIEEAKRYNFPLSISIIDIDFFKKINDTYGHLTGDCILKELSTLMKENFRGSDTIIRYGGEEFLIVMPFTNLKDAYIKMENFRKTLQKYLFCGKQKLHLTISAGVAQLENEDISGFIQKADEKLYEAKKSGRNKVVK